MCRVKAALGAELAEVILRFGASFCAKYRPWWLQHKVMTAIVACRTAALGGQRFECDHCGARQVRFHSCRNRHCPKCQSLAKAKWLEARQDELLPVEYFHSVFTLPHLLNALIRSNQRLLYDLLFKAGSGTLLTLGRDPKRLGGQLGLTAVLHTWGQTLCEHVHLHCVVTGGALGPDGWIPCKPGFLFPVKVMSRLFRGKFISLLRQAYQDGQLRFCGQSQELKEPKAFAGLLDQLMGQDWVVYNKRPFAGPKQVLDYLGRYTHRVAISNQRILSINGNKVVFSYKDYADQNQTKTMALEGTEFIRRFLLHVLPSRFMRIRHYGLLANRAKHTKLTQARQGLGQPEPQDKPAESMPELMLRLTGLDILLCPHCLKGHWQSFASVPCADLDHRRAGAPDTS